MEETEESNLTIILVITCLILNITHQVIQLVQSITETTTVSSMGFLVKTLDWSPQSIKNIFIKTILTKTFMEETVILAIIIQTLEVRTNMAKEMEAVLEGEGGTGVTFLETRIVMNPNRKGLKFL